MVRQLSSVTCAEIPDHHRNRDRGQDQKPETVGNKGKAKEEGKTKQEEVKDQLEKNNKVEYQHKHT